MGWERRGNGQYYYRKKRINGRVVSLYIGGGEFAAASQVLDQSESASKALEIAAWQDEKNQATAIDQKVNNSLESLQGLIEQTLEGWGYRKVKGEWRKKRAKKN